MCPRTGRKSLHDAIRFSLVPIMASLPKFGLLTGQLLVSSGPEGLCIDHKMDGVIPGAAHHGRGLAEQQRPCG